MTTLDEENALVTSGGGFVQQGSIDWVALLKMTAGFTVQLLKRLAGGGVQPYTVAIARTMGCKFNLSDSGQNNVELAISKLDKCGAYGNVLWFGFGIDNIPRLLSRTKQGLASIALCAALSESYQDDMAYQILSELANELQVPEEMAPSMREWQTLVRQFEGVFSATDFPILVARYSTHMGLSIIPYEGPRTQAYTNANAIAKALCGISKVSLNEVASITITGPSEAAWLAAFSEWVLGLSIAIFDHNGGIAYSNCDLGKEQVRIFPSFNDNKPNLSLNCINTYRLDVGTRVVVSGIYQGFYMIGRLAWSHCLSGSFGPAFRRCIEEIEGAAVTAVTFGVAARIFTEMTLSSVGGRLDATCRSYSSHGLGLISSLISRFPELSPLRNLMEEAEGTDFMTAKRTYKEKISQLRSMCGCSTCVQDRCSQSRTGEYKSVKCMVLVVETILVLGRFLSCLHIAEDLYPTCQGLKAAYHDQKGQRVYKSSSNTREKGETSFEEKFGDSVRLIRSDIYEHTSALNFALQLFTGRPGPRVEAASAIASSGICVFFNSLYELDDGGGSAPLIHVMPGTVEFRGRTYHQVVDIQQSQFMGLRPSAPRPQEWDKFTQASLLVTAGVENLQVRYEIKNNQDMRACISPSDYARKSLRVRYPPDCPGDCPSDEDLGIEGLDSYTYGPVLGQDLSLFLGGSLSRCVAQNSFDEGGFGHLTILDKGCLTCSLKYASALEYSNILIIREK